MKYFARSQVEQIDPGLLPSLVKEARLNGYLQTVATTALIYDAFVTMDREAKYFWKLPRRPVDFVYFANRYIGILGAVAFLFYSTFSADLKECNFSVWTSDIANWLTVILTDYVLTIRVLALYSRDRTLSICLYLFLALEAVAKLAMVVYVDFFENVVVGGVDDMTMCGTDAISPWQFGIADWSLQLLYGVTLMVLALYKAAEYWRMSTGFKGFALVKVLIEDQVIYFLVVVLVSVFAMVEFTLDSAASDILDTLGNPAFLCILGSRLLLNLKEAGERGQNEGTNFVPPSRTVSDIEFGQPPAHVEGASLAQTPPLSVCWNFRTWRQGTC